MAITKRETSIAARVAVEDQHGNRMVVAYEEGLVFLTATNEAGDIITFTLPWEEWVQLVGTLNSVHWMERTPEPKPEA